MPHESRYNKTRDGYILEIESRFEVTLPKAFYRVKIAEAEELHQAAMFFQSNPARWFELCKKLKLPAVVKVEPPPVESPETLLLTKRDWKLIRSCLIARRKKIAIHAHTWERVQIGSEAMYNEHLQICDLLKRMGYND